MNIKYVGSALKSAVALIAFSLAGTAWGQCLPSSVNPTEADGLVTEFDGNMSCGNITGQFGCTMSGGDGECMATNPDGPENFSVSSQIRPDGSARWQFNSGNGISGIDSAITDAAQGGNGCLYAFQVDANSGDAGFLKSNGAIVLRNLTICADINDEPRPPPQPAPAAKIQACLAMSGESIEIGDTGVEITCPTGGAGINQRTIVVARDTDLDGNRVPDKGWQDENGGIAFDQFLCVCNGPDPETGEESQCNPNLGKNDVPDPSGEFAGLQACLVAESSDSSESIDFTNPTCVTSGGRRRCY